MKNEDTIVFRLQRAHLSFFLIVSAISIARAFTLWYGTKSFSKYFCDDYFLDCYAHGFYTPHIVSATVCAIQIVICLVGCMLTKRRDFRNAHRAYLLSILMLMGQSGACTVGLIITEDLERALTQTLEIYLKKYLAFSVLRMFQTQSYPLAWALENIQEAMHCCGVKNFTDFNVSESFYLVPSSCCSRSKYWDCHQFIVSDIWRSPEQAQQHIYTDGCLAVGLEAYNNAGLWFPFAFAIFILLFALSVMRIVYYVHGEAFPL